MLSYTSQYQFNQHSAYITPKMVALTSFGHQSETPEKPASKKTLLKQIAICVGASGLGHYLLGEQAHEVAEQLTFVPHWLGHIVSDSAVCCGIPTGVIETGLEKRPEKGLRKKGAGFVKALGKNVGKNFLLSLTGHAALGVPAEMAADGLQAATSASAHVASAASEAVLCCGIPSAALETRSSWLPKRWLKKAALKKPAKPLNVEI